MDGSTQKVASLDPSWDDACEIAKKAFDQDTSGSPAEVARAALKEARLLPQAVESVMVMLADRGHS